MSHFYPERELDTCLSPFTEIRVWVMSSANTFLAQWSFKIADDKDWVVVDVDVGEPGTSGACGSTPRAGEGEIGLRIPLRARS